MKLQFLPEVSVWALCSDAQGQYTPQKVIRSGRILKLIRDVIVVLVTCKNEEDPIKNEGARVATRVYVHLSNIQAQMIPKSAMDSGISNSSEL